MISTLPDYRCKGLGYGVTHKGLFDAAQNRITKAILMSSIMGQSLYRKICTLLYTYTNISIIIVN